MLSLFPPHATTLRCLISLSHDPAQSIVQNLYNGASLLFEIGKALIAYVRTLSVYDSKFVHRWHKYSQFESSAPQKAKTGTRSKIELASHRCRKRLTVQSRLCYRLSRQNPSTCLHPSSNSRNGVLKALAIFASTLLP